MRATIVVEAHAKVNLALETTGRRPDGFHDLVSVMQTVALADVVRVRPARDISLTCSVSELQAPMNLVYRAAEMLRARFDVRAGCALHVVKRIPVAAGLGGGSSDAAATLVALDRLWELQAGCKALSELAEELGSDVPFFLHAGTSLVQGRGEQVNRLKRDVRFWYILANPGVPIKTSEVFACLDDGDFSNGDFVRTLARKVEAGSAFEIGRNALQRSLFELEPRALRCYETVKRLASGRAFVSGSGPTIAAAFETREEAERACRRLGSVAQWRAVTPTWIPAEGETPCA